VEENIIEDYRQRAAYACEEAQKFKKLAETYSLYRLGVFGLFILCVCLAISVDEIVIIGIALAIMVVWFSWLIKKQSHFDEQKNYWLDMQKVSENEISSIQSNTNMYDNGAIFYNDKHYYDSDLDIFGSNSLFQLINRSATAPGIGKLTGWLNAPADRATILLRQQAVEEIAVKNDWKLQMQAFLLFSMKQQREQIKHLLSYLKMPVELEDKKWLHTYCKVAPWLLLAVIVVSIFYMPARYFIPVVALFNYRLVTSRKKNY